MHGILEAIVLADLRTCGAFWTASPRVRHLFAAVARDERRHAAFGRKWMGLYGRTAGVTACDGRLATWAACLRRCYERDCGLGELTRRRQAEYLELAGRHTGAEAAALAEALRSNGLTRTAGELDALASVFA